MQQQTVVLASGNTGKAREIAPKLKTLGWDVKLQSEFEVSDVAETGKTFVENALLKARNAASVTGLPALADDSGLVVPALGGRPGIYSARYAGVSSPYSEKMSALIAELDSELATGSDLARAHARAAYFCCVLVWLNHADDPLPIIAEGVWHGQLLDSPRGEGGFGYDPIFFLEDHGLSVAQLPVGQKLRISHRAQALDALGLALAKRTPKKA